MVISSFYSVFVTSDMKKMNDRFARTGSLKMLYHFETDEFYYYVMNDNSGNKTDFIQFKHKTMEDAFFAVRINTDDFDKMKAILVENGFTVAESVDTEAVKIGVLISNRNEPKPNVLLFEQKR